MDYDDNDFQSQNFQLGCEDNTKFPPSSPSYTLPKYDLDENLQVHLGFDIDQEVLLGIQCQQDNHWIEDFSRGSSRIEFSPSAADSCSISRHNNVWSEATSSESVEMLLKSVGQDDRANKQTCMEEQDACDGFGNLNDKMDSSLNTDRTLPSVPGDFIDTGPAVPPDKFVESLPGPSKDASGELARGECTLETRKDEESGSESMIPVNLISPEKCSLDPKVTFWTNSLGDGSMEKSEGDGHHSSAEMVASCNQENIALERVQVDSCSTSEPSLGSDAVELNSEKLSQQETADKLGGPVEVYPPEVGNPILSCDAHMNVESNTHQVRSEISCPNTEESSHIVRNMQETYILGTKGDKFFEGCLTHSDAQHVFSVPDTPKGVDQIEGKEGFLSVTENKQHFEGKNSSDGEGNLSSSVVNVSSPADLATGEVLNTNDGHDRLGTNPEKTTSWKLESRVLVDKVPEVGVCIPDIGLPVPDQPSDVKNAEGCRAFHPDNMEIDSVPERVESDVTKLASSNKMEGVSQLPTGNKQAMNLVEKQGGRPSLPVSDIVNFDSEEVADESSLKLGSSISVSQAESEQHTVTVCSSSVGVPSYAATQSASLAEKSISIKSNDDPQVSMARSGAKEDRKELSGDSTIHMSDQQLVFNVKKHEAGIPSFTISDVVNLDEKEEPVDGICTKLGSSVSFSNVEMEQPTICSTVIDLPSDITVFSSALVDNSPNKKYNNELQVSMNSTAAQESGKDLSEDSTIHSSVQQLVSDVEKPEAGIPSLPVSDIVYLDKKEELLDGASTELAVSVSKADETEQCTVCSTALALPSDTAAQSSALAEKSLSIKFNDEPQLSMSTTAAQVYGKELSGNSIIGASVEQLVSDFEKQGAGIPSSPVSDIVNFDKEEPVDGISTELGSSTSVSMPETGQHRVCTAFDLPYDAAAQSSALAEKSLSIKLNNEQVPTTTTTAQGYGKELFGDSTIHTSVQQLVVDVEKQKTTIPILPVSDIVNFDKEKPVGISTEFGSLVSVSMAETEQHTVCSTALDLPSHTAAKSSAFEEISIKSNEEPQVSMALTAAQEYDIANYDKKHEPTDGISRELGSSGSVSKAATVQHAVSTTALNLPSDTTGQSSALAERSLTIKSNADPQVSVAIPAAQESGDLIIHASISLLQEKDGYESTTSSLRAEAASIGDIPAESVPSSAHESSQGDEVNKCEEKSSSPLAENVIEQNTLEAVSGLSSTEPNCGSPTVISSKEQSQTAEDYHEDNGRSIVQNDPDDLPRVPTAIDGQADIVKSTANEISESFTFEVGSLADLSQRETTNGWKTFSNIHPSGLHQTEEVSPTESGACQTDSGLFEETRHESRQVSNEKPVHVMPDKMRDKNTVASGGTSPKGTSTKAKSAKKSSQMHKAEKATNISSPAPNFSGSFSRVMQMEELRQYPLIDGSTKQPAGLPVQTTNLPDLNSLASPVLFRQPFTDLQQVQLRAQIFVYGSLIQSAAPDEACMKSAFADSDSERTMWESTWRVAVERCYSQKSPLSNLETPVHSHLGSRISEQVSRSDTLHGKPLRSPAGKSSCKSETPPPVLNPTMSLSSPLWSIATSSRDALHPSSVPRVSVLDPQQSPSPLSPYQSSQMRQYMGNTTPWLSQVAAPGPPWVFSPQNTTLDVGIPGTESVQVTPMRDILVPCTTSVHLASPSLLASTVGPMNVLPGQAVLMDVKNSISAPSEELSSGGQKSRKRKKNPSPQEVIQMLQVTHPGAASTPVTKHLSTSAGTLASHTSSKISDGNFVATSSPVVPSSHFQIISGGGDTCQRIILPEEISSRVELAKLYQEDAASFAASAVRHCQGIWSQLSIQKKSGLVSCDEVKLASAAVAAAAAASVAKAAAEAAKLASNAALQAKLMADEVLRIGMLGPDTIFPDAGVSFRKATPASNLKGKEKANSSSSLIVAAREAAKRRVIAASAASKQAENLEAIVKAAEIAVEAVAQAGAVIAMGDPVPLKLNELLALGLDGYWKLQQVAAGHKEEGIAKAGEGRHKMISERPSNKKDTKENTEKQSPSKVVSKQSEEVLHGLVNGIPRESGTSERTLEQHKGCKQSDLAKNIGVVLESEIGSRKTIFTSQNDEGERDENTGKSAENGIQEGSVVEVFTDEDGLRGVWFSAKVLNVKDGKAFICYDELLEEEGSEHIKEWVPLEGEADKPPRIRPAHPLTPAMKYEGTRKRRRAAIGNYAWSVGDRVDVWMRDGWWEAIVSEKDKDDDTKLTVRFPAEGGSSSAVRLWSLRPSLIWKNGQWIDWPRENNFCLDKSDMPHEKRQKFGRHEVGTDSQTEEQLAELSKDMGVEESWSQMLSAKDRIFTVGKKAGEEAPKVKRTGLQQEGSKVIFGVPKPGKKRKFMEVSKHYDADEARNKASEGADSMKLMKYLMPQGSCRGWRNTPKVDFRGKQMPDPKPKVLRPKAQTILSKSVIEKDSSTVSVQDPLANAKSLVGREESNSGREESNSGKQKLPEVGSSSNNIRASEPEGPVLVSSNAPSFKKSSAVVTEKGVKGKLGPAGGKLAIDAEGSGTDDHAGKPVSESIEPRRSNRRIQPTSRLLEGLQSSSLVVSKLPPLSHDKDIKARQRSGSSSRGSHG